MALRYRKRPVVVEAEQWDGTARSAALIVQWIREGGGTAIYRYRPQHVVTEVIEIETLEGTMNASPLDFVIKGVDGEFYPCKPDIFHQTYEYVDEVAW